MNPSTIYGKTEAITGPVVWYDTGSRGFCACPGAALHTKETRPNHCSVFIEGTPTIYCFHNSCQPLVAAANKRLRRAIGGGSWELILPDGSFLRSGEARIPAGQPIPPPTPKPTTSAEAVVALEKRILRDITLQADALKSSILTHFAWDPADMWEDSPLRLLGDPKRDWSHWLALWNPDDIVWSGDTFSSGREEHARNFRPAKEWMAESKPAGPFTCGSAFKPGSISRSNENAIRRFLVIESDTLSKQQIGAVCLYMTNRLGYTLKAVVDTGGKSLHGWFNLPADAVLEARLKAALTALGCDPALFKPSQPARCPGAIRDNGNLQSLLWCYVA